MSSYRNRPKGQYINEASWHELFKLTEQWKNAVDFQLYEIDFLQKLVETYFVKMLIIENLDELRELQKDLYQAENQSKILLNNIETHLKHIASIIDEPFTHDGSEFRKEHEQLEDNISEFLAVHDTIKHTTFRMVKDILQDEVPNIIWKYN